MEWLPFCLPCPSRWREMRHHGMHRLEEALMLWSTSSLGQVLWSRRGYCPQPSGLTMLSVSSELKGTDLPPSFTCEVCAASSVGLTINMGVQNLMNYIFHLKIELLQGYSCDIMFTQSWVYLSLVPKFCSTESWFHQWLIRNPWKPGFRSQWSLRESPKHASLSGRGGRGWQLPSSDAGTLGSPPGVSSTHRQRPPMKCVGATEGRTLLLGDFVWEACRNNPQPSILKCISSTVWNKSENSQYILKTPVFLENPRNVDVSQR